MIHQAAREMAVEHMGEDGWARFAAANGLTDQHFIGPEYYQDSETMELVAAIASHLKLEIADALHTFGHHWIAFAGKSAYGRVLDMAGADLESFLDNLDRMHASIKSNMPHADMPSFQVMDSDDEGITLIYRSQRRGLEPFVAGILEAVGERFGERVNIAYEPHADGVEFRLSRETVRA